MDAPPDFAATLRSFMERALRSTPDLARLSGIPLRTIENWCQGRVLQPREINDLLKIARALALDVTDTTCLLESAHWHALKTVWEQAQQADDTVRLSLLVPWAVALEQSGTAPTADAPPAGTGATHANWSTETRLPAVRNTALLALQDVQQEGSVGSARDSRRSERWLRYGVRGAFGLIPLVVAAEMAFRLLRPGADTISVLGTCVLGALTGLALITQLPPGQRALVQLADRWNIQRRRGLWATLPAVMVILVLGGLRLLLLPFAAWYSDQGLTYQQNDQLTKALLQFQRAVSLNPSDAAAHYNLATAFEDAAQFDRAEMSYRAAIDRDPEFYPAYNNLARLVLQQRKRYAEALDYFQPVEQRNPRTTRVQYAVQKNRGWALLGLKNYTQAETELRSALVVNHQGAAAYCLLAQVLEERPQPNMPAARAAWTNCLRYAYSGDVVEPVQLERARERLIEGTAP